MHSPQEIALLLKRGASMEMKGVFCCRESPNPTVTLKRKLC